MALTVTKQKQNNISYLRTLDQEFQSDNLSITEAEYIKWIQYIEITSAGDPYLIERLKEE